MKRDQIRTGIVTGSKSRCILIITGLVLFVFSCISPFKTDYKGQGDLLVVDGSLKNKLNHALKALQAKSSG